jgi:acyl carrier protein
MTDRLIEAFAGVLGVEPAVLNEQTSPANTAAWDSMANIMLITEIEAIFAVQLSTSDIESMGSLGKARTVLRKLGADV